MDQYCYHTFGLYPADSGERVPGYLTSDALEVPAFGATRQFNPERVGGNGYLVRMRFHYRYKSSSLGRYATYLGADLGAFLEAKIRDYSNS